MKACWPLNSCQVKLVPACSSLSDCLNVRVHPAPIYETILYLGVFAILWSMRKTSHPAGRLMYWYLLLGGASRFFVEFWRINPRVFYMFSEAQLIAFAMMVIGGIALLVTREKNQAVSGLQPGEKESRPAMSAAQA